MIGLHSATIGLLCAPLALHEAARRSVSPRSCAHGPQNAPEVPRIWPGNGAGPTRRFLVHFRADHGGLRLSEMRAVACSVGHRDISAVSAHPTSPLPLFDATDAVAPHQPLAEQQESSVSLLQADGVQSSSG